MRPYWRFYWPLALTGIVMVLSVQFQNGVLARYPEAITELAVFALASSTFALFQASLVFTAQLSNVFARSPAGTRRCQRFVTATSAGLAAVLIALLWLPPTRDGLGALYGIDAILLSRVVEYLWWMAPLLLLTGQRMYYSGLLVQSRLTGWVTGLNVASVLATAAVLILGFSSGWRPVHTLVGAQATAALVHVLGSLAVYRTRYRPPTRPEHEHVSYGDLLRFFGPVGLTGVMFAISRPLLYALVGRAPEGLASIAAMRVAFDFAMIFQQAANQFRHFFVTFGPDDLRTKRRFMALVAAGLTALMLVFAITPLAGWLLGDLMGVGGPVLDASLEVLSVMCLLPGIIIARNYFHGLLMVRHRTGAMAAGSILRVAGIYGIAQTLHLLGALGHVSASFVLVLGFLLETAVVAWACRGVLPAPSADVRGTRVGDLAGEGP